MYGHGESKCPSRIATGNECFDWKDNINNFIILHYKYKGPTSQNLTTPHTLFKVDPCVNSIDRKYNFNRSITRCDHLHTLMFTIKPLSKWAFIFRETHKNAITFCRIDTVIVYIPGNFLPFPSGKTVGVIILIEASFTETSVQGFHRQPCITRWRESLAPLF